MELSENFYDILKILIHQLVPEFRQESRGDGEQTCGGGGGGGGESR